jgi:imidazolonepropionase-like amidohydrolase/ABC-type multidrug transport system permease subunit
MRAYIGLCKINLVLSFRDRSALLLNYLLPLSLFFMFAELLHADRGTISYVVTMALAMGIFTNGLLGAGMHAARDREANILRRFKVTPISPAPLLVASLVTGFVTYVPVVVLVLGLAGAMYGMPAPSRPVSLFLLLSLGILAFRSLGLIVASVANSSQEANLISQVLFLPMLMLNGTSIPLAMLPPWLQAAAQFLPSSHLTMGLQAILLRGEGLGGNWTAFLALGLTTLVSLFLSFQLFRWEKEEKLRSAAKLWVPLVLSPFLIVGLYQVYTKEQIRHNKLLFRQIQRNETTLVRGARIFTGDGRVIESGAVLIKEGKIVEVFEGPGPDAARLKAEVVESAGKTVLPGFIDVHVHLGVTGGIPDPSADPDLGSALSRSLAAYLYSGVTATRSAGDALQASLDARARVAGAEVLGATLYACGPLFTAEGGHGTEYFADLSPAARSAIEGPFLRLPKTPEEAREQVKELKKQGIDCIKAILEAGFQGAPFNRMDLTVFRAVAEEARRQGLPLVVHTGDSKDVVDALDAGAASIEHGSLRDEIPDEVFTRMARAGVYYVPTLSVVEGLLRWTSSQTDGLSRPLVQQVVPEALFAETRKALWAKRFDAPARASYFREALARGSDNLRRAHRAGVKLAVGSDAGNPLVFHGPTVQRELQLWAQAGIPPQVALQAATHHGAELLGAGEHLGRIEKGYDADLLVVDGDPLSDLSATERISLVIYKGEQINRSKLFSQQ